MIVLASQLMKIVAACRPKLLPKRSNGGAAASEGAAIRLPAEVPVRVQCFWGGAFVDRKGREATWLSPLAPDTAKEILR